MGLRDPARKTGRAAAARAGMRFEETVWAPLPGAYLTDEVALFHVEHAISDSASGELCLELENCSTLEMVLCPARTVGGRQLRSVVPTPAP